MPNDQFNPLALPIIFLLICTPFLVLLIISRISYAWKKVPLDTDNQDRK
jgi:hypothetical protein